MMITYLLFYNSKLFEACRNTMVSKQKSSASTKAFFLRANTLKKSWTDFSDLKNST